GHHRLGASGPLVEVVAALRSDPPLEGVEAVAVAQVHQPRGLVRGCDVAPHGRGIGAQPPRRAAEQRHHRLALDPPAQVPQRGIEAGERAAAVAAGKLVLALLDALDERLDGKVSAPSAQGATWRWKTAAVM